MKLSTQQIIFMMIATLTTFTVQAHPGHDHSAVTSSAVHVIFYIAIVAVMAIVGYVAVKKLRSDNTDK